jgi:hypothetical protein
MNMAKRRVVNVPIDKHAEGESFSKELEKTGRYMVGMALVSLKTVGRYDLDRTSEFYFMVDGGKIFRRRIPDRGNIELRENQVFEAKTDEFTLWCEFITFKTDQEKILKIKVQLKESDPGIDDMLGEAEYTIKCPQETEYVILDSKDGKTKAKFKIYAKKTLY